MTNTKLFYFLLPLLLSALACTLTAKPTPTPLPQSQAAVIVAQVAKPNQGNPTSPAPAPRQPAPDVCKVSTGLPAGTLNLRACGAVSCPILATVNEGATLTITQTLDGWLDVKAAGGLNGWVNSKFTNCTNEVTK